MISAEEARKRTHEYIENYIVDEELKKVEEGINAAIKRGEYWFSYNDILHCETGEKLKELGYTVQIYRYPRISWNQKG